MDAVEQQKVPDKKGSSNSVKPKEELVQRVNIEKTPSLKETLSKINAIGKEQEKSQANTAHSNNNSAQQDQFKKVSIEEVSSHFEVYLDKIKKTQPRLFAAMKTQAIQLNEDDVFELSFQNNSQLEEFRSRIKPALISHLRNALGTESIELAERVVDAENLARPKLFSDSEKFKQMSETNPALKKLKNLFGLDFD